MICESLSISPEAIKEAKMVEKMQEWLYEVDDSTIDEAVNFFKNSVFLNGEENRTKQLFQNLQVFIDIRPALMHTYIDLVSKLFDKNVTESTKKIVMRIFLSQKPLPDHIMDNVGNFLFFKLLYPHLNIEISAVVDRIKTVINKHEHSKYLHCLLYCIYSREITKIDIEFSKQLFKILCDEFPKYSNFPVETVISNLAKLKTNNWELFNKSIYNGALPGTISEILRNDDVEKLQVLMSSDTFNVNGTINPSIFEPSRYLQKDPKYIQYAGFYGSVNCFKFLLLNGAETNCEDLLHRTLAHFVVGGGNLELVRICEQRKCNFQGTIQVATRFYHFNIFDWLHRVFFHDLTAIHPIFGSILHESAAYNNIKSIFYCCENKIDVNIRANDKTTPLHKAVKNMSYDAVNLLINTDGIDINAKDAKGSTPLHVASLFDEPEMIEELLKAKDIDINAVDIYGMTPLHMASQDGNSLATKSLLQSEDIDVNCKDETFKMTPLHFAAQDGEYDTVKVLLSKSGIDVKCKDSQGMDPLSYAEQSKSAKTIQLLQSASSD